MYRIVQIIRNQDGEIIERIPKHLSSSRVLPRNGEFILLRDNGNVRFPILNEKQPGEWEIIEDDDKLEFENDIDQRLMRQKYGKRILAIVGRMNDAKDLTISQKQQMRNDFKLIRESLQDGDIKSAEESINALVVDDITITDDDKTFLLADIANKKVSLGYEPD